ncbi:MAG: flavodoxin [Candidatus Ratteibacteria bacterium]|nr:flavodoxin [Candidatus Ratteibacteria bacterium]
MKISIVYFSLSGSTKMLSQYIAEYLRSEGFSVAVNPLKTSDTGTFLTNCINAFRKKKVKLEYVPDIKKAEVVFLGSPVWAFNITPAIRTFLESTDLTGKKIFLFITYGSGKGKERAMEHFCQLVKSKGGNIIGKMDIKGKQVHEDFKKLKEIVVQCLKESQLINSSGQ